MAPLLGYWEVRGLGTPIRLLLEFAGVQYEEKLYKCGGPPDFDRSEWLADKFNLDLKFPNLPYYIDGDTKITQSGVILRYLARKYGLDGKTEAEKLDVDLMHTQVCDYHMSYVSIVYNSKFLELKDDYAKTLPDKMKALTAALGDRKFVAGDYVTYADFVLYEYLEGQIYFKSDLLKDYPVLEQFYKRVLSLEAVDKYFKSPKAIKFPFNGAPAFFGGAHSDQLLKK